MIITKDDTNKKRVRTLLVYDKIGNDNDKKIETLIDGTKIVYIKPRADIKENMDGWLEQDGMCIVEAYFPKATWNLIDISHHLNMRYYKIEHNPEILSRFIGYHVLTKIRIWQMRFTEFTPGPYEEGILYYKDAVYRTITYTK